FTGVRVDYPSRLLRACIRPHDGGFEVSSSPPLLAHRILSKPQRNAHRLARSHQKHPRKYLKEAGAVPSPSPALPTRLRHCWLISTPSREMSFSDCLGFGTFCHPSALASGAVYRRI